MKSKILMTVIVTAFVFLNADHAQAQTTVSNDLPKYEVGADFSALSLNSGTTLPGVGGRFTYNLNKHVALEAAGYFFPGKCDGCTGEITGHITEGLLGVKAGQRFKKWGIFGKARPGFAKFGRGGFEVVPLGLIPPGAQVNCFGPAPSIQPCFSVNFVRRTVPVVDLGGVIEFYPSKRFVVRFDGGDTIIRYTRRTFNTLTVDPANPTSGIPILAPVTDPGRTRHSFQFIGGVGFRF
jgi:hypothetical protein